ncbi:cis-aconitate decarboxylase [Biomphalaria glabrata]|uniref:Cis-aconitate decarboxylase-like n=1 Tax=Biomphalaria glabrata TaxID=6526 RepID=A0A9W3AEK0_BIOGL|nr:cis-aconitate decarboxylase-like [Biomphalaria glabrata]KAI8754494.1 cis-aconitate decarboxylase-like [Biomphalaria glabrata]KAI8774344.1 cis-aconitate decarboxylase [Biomphalaria glabrata]
MQTIVAKQISGLAGLKKARSLQKLTTGSMRLPGAMSSANQMETTLTTFNEGQTVPRKEFSSTSGIDRSKDRRLNHTAAAVHQKVVPAKSVTTWISDQISNTSLSHLSDRTIHRSKRMLLDTLGVGILGFQTDIAQNVMKTCVGLEQGSAKGNHKGSVIWGSRNMRASPATAAYINGVSAHAMDFDDTWHPATHPSGPTLPAIIALAESMQGDYRPSLENILVAYNVGIQVQGLLLRSSASAKSIPCRFHPPAVVGVMGSAAACANLLGFGPEKCRNALGIAASFAGAPMANAGTTTKPLHAGKAARFGLEAALLADQGIEGNSKILDMPSGFGAFYDDFNPEMLLKENVNNPEFLLHDQDIALKRFPAHLGMHWTIDAALAVRSNLEDTLVVDNIKKVIVRAPKSKYINRPLPSSTHEARHSFQFNACTALLDGEVTPKSYENAQRTRRELVNLLEKTEVQTPEDNKPSFNEMYVEVHIHMLDGSEVRGRCDTPYGHWRNPLSDADVVNKFSANTTTLAQQRRQEIVDKVKVMSASHNASDLARLLYAY